MVIDAAGHLAHCAGVCIYRRYLRHATIRKVLLSCVTADLALQGAQLVLIAHVNPHGTDLIFAVGDALSGAIIGQIMMMPLMVMAAQRCPKRVEGTVYSTIMAITNLSSILASTGGALLSESLGVRVGHFNGLRTVAVICMVMSLLPIPCVWAMPSPSSVVRRNDDDGMELSAGPPRSPLTPGALLREFDAADGATSALTDNPLADAHGTEEVAALET